MKSNYILFGLISLSIISFLTDEVFSEPFLLYENPAKNISIEYPANWNKTERVEYNIPEELKDDLRGSINEFGDERIVTFYSENGLGELNIVIENLPYYMSLQNYFDANLPLLRQIPNFTLVNSSNTTIANLPAMKVLYTFTMTDPTLPSIEINFQISQIYSINNGKVHIISFKTLSELYDYFQPTVDRMYDSYKIN